MATVVVGVDGSDPAWMKTVGDLQGGLEEAERLHRHRPDEAEAGGDDLAI
jgi:hypothetical protein